MCSTKVHVAATNIWPKYICQSAGKSLWPECQIPNKVTYRCRVHELSGLSIPVLHGKVLQTNSTMGANTTQHRKHWHCRTPMLSQEFAWKDYVFGRLPAPGGAPKSCGKLWKTLMPGSCVLCLLRSYASATKHCAFWACMSSDPPKTIAYICHAYFDGHWCMCSCFCLGAIH